MKNKVFLLALMLIGFVNIGNAQDYRSSVGLRIGPAYGVSVKHFVTEKSAFEGLLTTRFTGFTITGLYEYHRDLDFMKNLRWYYGGGAHLAFWRADLDPRFPTGTTGTQSVIGIDGIIGMELTFGDLPLALALDWKPLIDFVNLTHVSFAEVALTIRYTFKPRQLINNQ